MDNETKNAPPTKIGKTWFMERGDGKVFACNEQEAWNLLRNKGNWQRTDFKIIGVSDGQTYVKALAKSQEEKNKIDVEINSKSAELTRYLNTLDKFKFEQLLDDTDDKVIKVKAIIDGLKKEIEDLNKRFAKGYQDIVDAAFKAELKKAKGRIEMPGNNDISTPHGSRDVILRNLPR